MKGNEIVVKIGKIDDIDLPPIIYKYRTWSDKYHQRFIKKREVFLASPKTFEDEFDCKSPTRFDLLTKKQIYQYFIWSSLNENLNFTRQQHRKFARHWAKTSDVNNKEVVKQFMEKSIDEYQEREGILSLTENWDNDFMWKKYAENETGFCIGYNTKIMFNFLGGGGPVSYYDELPIVLPEPFMNFEESLKNRVYSKLRKWEFEQEYRTKKFWPYPVDIKTRQLKLPVEAFNKVILGNKISLNDKKEIIESVKEFIGDIEIIERKNIK